MNDINKGRERLTVRVTAESEYKRKFMFRLARIGVSSMLLLLGMLYGVLYIVNETGYFTITVDRESSDSLIMSDTVDFGEISSVLKAKAPETMDNISESWLPLDIDSGAGDHSKDDYIAYTFYVQNGSDRTITYDSYIDIRSVTKNTDNAVRVKVYLNGEETVYAKRSKDGSPEPNTVPFSGYTKVMNKSRSNFEIGEVDRYTIVIWLEGDDPECTDDIIGGLMKMNMVLKIKDKKEN